jgi:hypothetical protein
MLAVRTREFIEPRGHGGFMIIEIKEIAVNVAHSHCGND